MTTKAAPRSFKEICIPGTPLEKVTGDFDFLEGPIWHPARRVLIFSDILGNSLYEWSEAGSMRTLRRNSYMANGNAFDHRGRVITCEHATSALTRTDFAAGGSREVLADRFDGKQLNSPNDVVVKRDGVVYFTDPTSGRSEGYGVPRVPELPYSGVYCLEPETGALGLLVDDFAKPNGLCFSPDETLLYVNDTERSHIRIFDVSSGGGLANGRLFARLEGALPGVADGMKVDQAGNLYSCGPGGIHVFDTSGAFLGLIETPEPAANLVFGGEEFKHIYITATTSLYRLSLEIPGHPTFLG